MNAITVPRSPRARAMRGAAVRAQEAEIRGSPTEFAIGAVVANAAQSRIVMRWGMRSLCPTPAVSAGAPTQPQ